jgi:hypothetical protein
MPGEFSQEGANRALDAVTGRATQTAGTRYLALCSTAPTDTALGTEIATAGYARQTIAWTAPSGDPSSTQNTAVQTFGAFSADPPNVTHAELFDVSSGGTVANRVAWWALTTARDAASGDSIQVAAGGAVLTND